MKKFFLIISLFAITNFYAKSQDLSKGQVSGNFQLDMQTYAKDTIIGAKSVPEDMLLNSYANINYTLGKFKAGVRFEGYHNVLQGFNGKNEGAGLAFRYASYQMERLEVTVGNFYEQFGNGLILRAYEDKTLDYDNAFDGVRLKYNIANAVFIKALVGRQRDYFGKISEGYYSTVYGDGLVRGIDAEVVLSELWAGSDAPQIVIGGGLVSKYQEEKEFISNGKKYKYPLNTTAFAQRLNVNYKGFNLSTEYAHKINDPSADNGNIFKEGNSLLANLTYSQKGLGILLSAKRVDNMSFRSERNASLNSLMINYLPTISKNHTYSLAAMYPYATQPNGEVGFMAEVMYKFPKASALGGKYGTSIALNFSRVNSIDKEIIDNPQTLEGYKSDFFTLGDEVYFQDFNIEISKKFSKKVKGIFTYQNIIYNYDVIQGVIGHEDVKAHIGIADISYKFARKKVLRLELQGLFTKQDKGDWAMALLEYSLAPHWFFSISDMYNYGNDDDDYKVHYYTGAIAYVNKGNRFQIGYGKQREGIMCVGGVCRAVPAANGLTLSISSSF